MCDMGQKINPHGMRVGVIKNWDSRWFGEEKKEESDGKPHTLLSTSSSETKFLKQETFGIRPKFPPFRGFNDKPDEKPRKS